MPRDRDREDVVLDTPVRELGLTLKKSRFHPLIGELGRELARAGIRLRPHFYLSTEYGCLERTATIGLLWTDGFAHTHKLARKHGVRTRNTDQIRRTLRHEAGHAFCYVHKLYKTPRFRELFGVRGRFFESYPEIWRPGARERKRLARGEVILIYATRHADEDFAVSFEHWMTALADGWSWRRRYKDRPLILEKVAYVEEIVREVGKKRVPVPAPELDEPIDEVRLTLREWFHSVVHGTNYNLHPKNAAVGA